MALAALEVVKDLRRAFSTRRLHHHLGPSGVRVHADGERKIFVVLDPRVSKSVLASRLVENQDYFSEPLAQMASTGRHLPRVTRYFAESPLFKEGTEHRNLKSKLKPLIDQACDFLNDQRPNIVRHMLNRSPERISPISFSEYLVEISFGLTIRHLTGVSMKCALRALRLRSNVFYFHFHPTRHTALELALGELNGGRRDSDRDEDRWNVAESLIVMGVDPSVAAVCGAISEPESADFSMAATRYAPTSFVSRRSIGSFSIEDHAVTLGDVLYLSLVKPEGIQNHAEGTLSSTAHRINPAIAFGAGPHMCLGRAFALAVSEVAEDAYRHIGAERFDTQTLIARGDGAFLSFGTRNGT